MPKKLPPMKKGGGKRPCIALAMLAALALTLGLSAAAHAEEVPIVSMKRLAIGAQVGAQWRRDTATDTGFESKPAVKLVPTYRLHGPASGMAKGSLALSFPAELSLTSEHQVSFGIFLSIVLFDGSDPE